MRKTIDHQIKRQRRSASRGFSLVELMVSLTIFSIIVTASIGALLTIIDANSKSQALYSAMTNLSFMMDSITRNLRTSNTYFCGDLSTGLQSGSVRDCNLKLTPISGVGGGIAFTREKDGTRVGYALLTDSNGNGYIAEQDQTNNTGWLKLTSDDVVIDNFNLKVTNTAGLPDTIQPQIFIVIKGKILNNNGLDTATTFILQSDVTERLLNF